jgi:hypothetical protein
MQDPKTLPLTDDREDYHHPTNPAPNYPELFISSLLVLLVATIVIVVLLSLKHPIKGS